MTVQRWEQPALGTTGRDVVDGWAAQLAGVAKLADYIAQTEFVPKAYRGQPAAVAAAILAGRELGVGPMQSLSHLYVVDGRPAMSAQLMRALVLAHGHTLRVVELTSTRCTLAGTRKGATEQAATFTMDDARNAGLAGKGPWRAYPRAMLLARATGELCRAIFPDVLGGMAYTVEEATDLGESNGAGSWEPTPPPARTITRAPKTPRGAASSSTDTPPPSAQSLSRDRVPPGSVAVADPEQPRTGPSVAQPPSPPPTGPRAPLPGDEDTPENGPVAAPTMPPAHEEPPSGERPGNGPERGLEPVTAPQRAHVFALLTQLRRMEPRALRLRTVSGLVRRRLTTLNELTAGETTALIDTLIRLTESTDGDAELEWLVRGGWEAIEEDELIEAEHDQPALFDEEDTP